MKNKSPILLLLSIIVVVLVLGMVLGFSGNRREGLSMSPTGGAYFMPTTPYNNNSENLGCNPDPGNAISGYNKYYFTNGKLNAQGQKCLVTTDYKNYNKIKNPELLTPCTAIRQKLIDAKKNGTLQKITGNPNFVNNGVLTCRGNSCIANGTNVCA